MWETIIGLEIHVQLDTKSKLFSSASTQFGSDQNTQASIIDLGMPGVLPVLNRKAVDMAIKFGLAVNAKIAKKSIFARKNYFTQTYLKVIRFLNMNCRSFTMVP